MPYVLLCIYAQLVHKYYIEIFIYIFNVIFMYYAVFM